MDWPAPRERGLHKQRQRGIMLLFVGATLAVLLASVGEIRTLLALCVVMALMGVVRAAITTPT